MRRRFLQGTAVLLALGGSGAARAQPQTTNGYPNRPIRIVVPFGAGGFSDTVARLAAQILAERLRGTAVVDNRPGAAGNLAGEIVAQAAPDGYTLFLSNIATNAINPNIYERMPFDPDTAFDPVVLIARTPNLVLANNDLPVRSLAELIALAKARPGALHYGTPGNGTSGHLSGALFCTMAGVQLTHVPYRGSPLVLTDLVNGQLQLAVDNALTWAPHAREGRVRALGVTGRVRTPLLPEVPTLHEAGLPGFEATSWFGISAPRGTPAEITMALNQALNAGIATDAFRKAVNGAEVAGGSPEEYRGFTVAERRKWGEVTRQIGLRVS